MFHSRFSLRTTIEVFVFALLVGSFSGAVARNWPSASGSTTPGAVLEDGSTGANLVSGGALKVTITGGSGGAVDEAAFTAGTSTFTLGGGFYQTTATTNPLTNGQGGAFQLTATRALFVNFRNNAGTEIGTSTTPVRTDPTGTTTQPVSQAPSAASTAGVAPVPSTALAANQVIKASAGNLYSFEVSADSTLSAAAWWIMIHNATSAPGDGAVTPLKCYAMSPGTTGYSGAFPTPAYFSTGIVIGVSTTGCFTKTASTHAFISGDAQ